MKLNPKQFKRFKELQVKAKEGSISSAEQAELDELTSMRNSRGSNDLAWWKNYPALLKDAVNIPFNWIPGTKVNITGYAGYTGELDLGVIARAVLRPSIGRSTGDEDPFNAQIRQLWLDMHRKYRGIGTYEKSDLGITILAINGFFETLAKFERIYGVINSYHIGNRTVPYGLKEVLGISNDLEQNLADFRYTLNLAITKAKQLCLPKGMTVLQSDIVALANVFKDSANRRAFLYMFDQDLYAIYDPTMFAEGGVVKYTRYRANQSGLTPGGLPAFRLTDIITILNTQLNALLNDDDIARMCSDLLAAYGPENVLTMVELPEDYKVEPVEDYERKVQFHNLTVIPSPQTIFNGIASITSATDANAVAAVYPIVIYQTNNTIINRLGASDNTANYAGAADGYHPTFDQTSASHGGFDCKIEEILFDTFVDEPGETEVMCGTRYCALAGGLTLVNTNVYRQEVEVMGTKVCSAISVYSFDSVNKYSGVTIYGSVVTTTRFASFTFGFFHLMQMDWHPTFYVRVASGALHLFGDVDNFAIVNRTNLERLHEVALLSGYKIPMVSKD